MWSVASVAIWMPGLTIPVAHLLGVSRGVDAILYLSVAFLCYLVFRLYAALEKQDQVITRLVSELALYNPQLNLPAIGSPVPATSPNGTGLRTHEGDSEGLARRSL
jgi:hypothetical protein